MENDLVYGTTTYALIGDLFALALAAHVAGLLYFLLQRERISPRYRLTATLSSLVMISSSVMFARLAISWSQAFELSPTGDSFVQAGSLFSGQLRYVNWMVTVPILLAQVLVVLDLARTRLVRLRASLVVAGLAMVVTGYVGQFGLGDGLAWPLLWGTVSTVPFVALLALLWPVVQEGRTTLPGEAGATFGHFRWVFLFFWGLYPLGYVVAALAVSPGGAFLEQLLFTAADIGSKVFYGVLLTKVARLRSAADGWSPALDSQHPGDAEAATAEPTVSDGRGVPTRAPGPSR